MGLPVTLLAGLHAADRRRGATALLGAAHPCALVEFDLTELAEGWVRRTVRARAGVFHTDRVPVEACACSLAETLVPLLMAVALRDEHAALVVDLPSALEPEPVAVALDTLVVDGVPARDVVRVDAVLTAVDTGRLLDDLGTDDLLVDRGVALAESDRRAVAEVLVRQVEYANVLIAALADGPGAGLLGHLNPHARRVDVASPDLLRTGLHDPSTAAGWVERGSVSAPLAETSGGVSTVVFTARRPFHPQRLYDSLRDLVEGVARSRGTVWLASRPAERLCWESAGPNLSMGALGPWLADLPPRRWDEVGPVHRARAALDWDEATGDRATTLAFTGVGLDPVGLRALLEQCLTAPGEWSGERAGSSFTDPFAEYLESAP